MEGELDGEHHSCEVCKRYGRRLQCQNSQRNRKSLVAQLSVITYKVGKMRWNYNLETPTSISEKVGKMTTNRHLTPGKFHDIRLGRKAGFFANKLTVLRPSR